MWKRPRPRPDGLVWVHPKANHSHTWWYNMSPLNIESILAKWQFPRGSSGQVRSEKFNISALKPLQKPSTVNVYLDLTLALDQIRSPPPARQFWYGMVFVCMFCATVPRPGNRAQTDDCTMNQIPIFYLYVRYCCRPAELFMASYIHGWLHIVLHVYWEHEGSPKADVPDLMVWSKRGTNVIWPAPSKKLRYNPWS